MQLKKLLFYSCVFLCLSTGLSAQKKKPEETKPVPAAEPVKKPEAAVIKKAESPKKGPKPYKEIIDSTAISQKGLVTVHKMDDKYLFEIPDSLFGRDIMAITRYSKTAAGGGIFGGEEINRQVVKWEKGPNNNIFLRSITTILMSPDSTKPMAQAVKNSSADPIIANFEIKAIKKDSTGKKALAYVIDVTATFDADVQTFSLGPIDKQRLNIISLQKDRSFIQKISSYPINTEIRTVKTFSTTPPRISFTPVPQIGVNLPAGLDAGVVTMEFNTSMIL